MYCYNHPDRTALSACTGCEKLFCRECLLGVSDNAMFCARCEALKASQDMGVDVVREREDAQKKAKEQIRSKKIKQKRTRAAQVGIIVVALIIAFIQVPKMNSALQQPAPLRVGDYDTDENVNECITALWHVSKKLQNNELPGTDLFCPVGKKDFEVIESPGGDTIVRVSQPELYGFSEMRVSRLHPVPEVIK